MAPIGDGFVKSIEHKHFLKVFFGFVILLALAFFGYRYFIKDQAALERQDRQQYQAQQ